MNIKDNKYIQSGAKGFVLILVAVPIIAVAMNAYGNINPVPQLETVYKNSVEAVKRDRETCIMTEVALAKAKLANHYSGIQKVDNVDDLVKKAEGQGLSCSNL